MPNIGRRLLLLLVAVAALGVGGAAVVFTPKGQAAGDVPLPTPGAVVVAELFTSEGCSSCPPADAVLDRLVHQQPMSGVTVLGLGEHVDYWDRLGWPDPFSSAAFTRRQEDYDAQVFRTGSIYTPQLVVDGRLQVVGSDVAAVRQAIAQAAQDPKIPIDVSASLPEGSQQLQLSIRLEVPPQAALREAADIEALVVEDHLVSDVRRGENRGRRLTHADVVRTMGDLGTLQPASRDWAGSRSITVPPTWKRADLTAIALLQERQSRRIVGAGSVRIVPTF
jgi:hypothetical protein